MKTQVNVKKTDKAPKATKATKIAKAEKVTKVEDVETADQVKNTGPVKNVLQKTFTKAQKGLLDNIAKAVAAAPRGEKLTTVHIMAIKHSKDLDKVSAKLFCELTRLPKAYGIEFIRVCNLTDRLENAGLDLNRL